MTNDQFKKLFLLLAADKGGVKFAGLSSCPYNDDIDLTIEGQSYQIDGKDRFMVFDLDAYRGWFGYWRGNTEDFVSVDCENIDLTTEMIVDAEQAVARLQQFVNNLEDEQYD